MSALPRANFGFGRAIEPAGEAPAAAAPGEQRDPMFAALLGHRARPARDVDGTVMLQQPATLEEASPGGKLDDSAAHVRSEVDLAGDDRDSKQRPDDADDEVMAESLAAIAAGARPELPPPIVDEFDSTEKAERAAPEIGLVARALELPTPSQEGEPVVSKLSSTAEISNTQPTLAVNESPPVAVSSPPASGVEQVLAVAAGSAASPVKPPRGPFEADALPGPMRTERGVPMEIDAARLLGRVARAFERSQHRDGEIRLRLSPPELGSLTLQVQLVEGGLVARLETETAAAQAALIDNLPALRERLADQGMRIERFDVDLMQRQPGGMPDRPAEQRRDLIPVRPSAPERASSQRSVASHQPSGPVGHAGRLNVIV
jgi:flagellar hook-length control protein FliK